ncbi:S-adenosylmethionine:tRNA ribosyltransferase-isomerase [Natronoglycomyces albus]|uniref:S-adenosylmethionine:tRNA ribosyltransferase-isomerase n=1 Tax=Natronoglycomyces albus TaxID=2811108 RepID=A0A895XE02_9ACTN|nr:S-adenosylmethionine:tRNA ribosyltransferase-isomerase [Natronoglycomyces albus]QSB04041.1 S-adenosylmethionine:tRNA ribosyltransferase-isomerase [Natronoglycomyces albus]
MTTIIPPALEFTLDPSLEASAPTEKRNSSRSDVRLLLSDSTAGKVSHHWFSQIPTLLRPGDLMVVNNSATVAASVPTSGGLLVHFSTELEKDVWLIELRQPHGHSHSPYAGGLTGDTLQLPGKTRLRLLEPYSSRLWRAHITGLDVLRLLERHGAPIRYSYVDEAWPLSDYQTVFATEPGSAEMPSAGRPFTPEVVTKLVSAGIGIRPVTLHTGVSSLEGHELPYPERFDVPDYTARAVRSTRANGGRVIAVGTTVVRALESAVDSTGEVQATSGLTSHIVTPTVGVQAVDGLLTGLHEPASTHLAMLEAISDHSMLHRSYREAIDQRYLWHEFGDVHLIL